MSVNSKLWERSHLSFVASQVNVASLEASTASWIVIPAPSAVDEVSPEPLFRVIFLSSTSRVAVLIVVVLPWTFKSPVIVRAPVIVPPAEVVSNFLLLS